jgi:hypothetical protein
MHTIYRNITPGLVLKEIIDRQCNDGKLTDEQRDTIFTIFDHSMNDELTRNQKTFRCSSDCSMYRQVTGKFEGHLNNVHLQMGNQEVHLDKLRCVTFEDYNMKQKALKQKRDRS